MFVYFMKIVNLNVPSHVTYACQLHDQLLNANFDIEC